MNTRKPGKNFPDRKKTGAKKTDAPQSRKTETKKEVTSRDKRKYIDFKEKVLLKPIVESMLKQNNYKETYDTTRI